MTIDDLPVVKAGHPPFIAADPPTSAAPSTATGARRTGPLASLIQTAAAVALLVVVHAAGSDMPGWLKVASGAAIVALLLRSVVGLGRWKFGPAWDSSYWLSIVWLVILCGAAVLASVLPLRGPTDAEFIKKEARPALSIHEPLGRDEFGRSELSRVIYGARVSLGIGVGAAALGAIVGGTLGLVAGYARGWIDSIISLIADSMLAFPPLILLISLVAVLPKTATTIAIGVGALTVPAFIRLARANTLIYAQREFVVAAHCLGLKRRRILFREILPNVALPIIAYAFIVIAIVIVAEGSLSYLGVGIQPPHASWGRMIADGQPRFGRTPHLVFVPSIVMFVTLLAFNRLGERLRELLAPAGRR